MRNSARKMPLVAKSNENIPETLPAAEFAQQPTNYGSCHKIRIYGWPAAFKV